MIRTVSSVFWKRNIPRFTDSDLRKFQGKAGSRVELSFFPASCLPFALSRIFSEKILFFAVYPIDNIRILLYN
ncbi:MAG TPA: hypothetical protein DE060_21450 [Lentisphaeria bacterium]|nr:hypothetical protein [Lentisphaeria bacterium]HCG51755.1 hypothetical protein [Lentisphaeria bacterium]